MHPRTRLAFVHEMQKMSAESRHDEEAKDIKSKRRAEAAAAHDMSAHAHLGFLGANLGAYATVMALLKSPSQPGEAGAMSAHVKSMAKKMELPSDVSVRTPGSAEGGGWSPYYDPSGKEVNTPLHVRDAIIAHELGHAKNDMLAAKAGEGVRGVYRAIEGVSRLGSGISLFPTLAAAAKSKDMSYKPGVIQAIISSPMLAEEAAASARATAHLIREHGVGKGVWKSLPLVPAFATYASIAGAPLLVTYIRRRLAAKAKAEALMKEKKSSKDEDGLSFFERHPKKIIGGSLAALGTGAYLLSKGKKGGGAALRSGGGSGAKAPAVHKPAASSPKPAQSKAPAKLLTHEEAKARGYPGAGPKNPAHQTEKHQGAEYIQAVREEGLRRKLPVDVVRRATRMKDLE